MAKVFKRKANKDYPQHEIDSVISDVEDLDVDSEDYSNLFAEAISSNISSGF